MVTKESVLINIEQLLQYARKNLSMDTYDIDFVRNTLLDHFHFNAPISNAADVASYDNINDIIDNMTKYATEQNIIDNDSKALYEAKLFGFVTPMPSSIILKYDIIKSVEGIENATKWLFELCKANNYIKMEDISKNIIWNYSGTHGDLVVTINLSKPEKDPKQIAAALKAKTGYPACMLCPSNVGYAGTMAHPARQTLRIIPIELNEEEWSIQFSPYQYYNEHLIALCNEHRPMDVNADCLARLVDFVDQFPHYFMGSNAALPIVGGSILTHDHYQGGGKELPMFKAPIRKEFKSPIKGVDFYILDWYNSVVRVTSKNKQKAIDAAVYVIDKWKVYSDESVGILASTDAQHNAVTPIARFENGKYIVDMILRNNRTDSEHPYGIYHPTEDLHNIKKEGIGIIEVMGTFILPGRLDKELADIGKFLDGSVPFDYNALCDEKHPLTKHKDMAKSLVETYGTVNADSESIIRDYINNACERILECTAVFKNTEEHAKAFDKFMVNALECKTK